jgi:hypothetical protein
MTQKEGDWNKTCALYIIGELTKNCYNFPCSKNYKECELYKEISFSIYEEANLEKLMQISEETSEFGF